MNGLKNNKIIGISRIRNVDFIIGDLLDYLSNYLSGVILYDDDSSDNTLNIIENHSLVLHVIKNSKWESNKQVRKIEEGRQRQLLFDKAKEFNPDWIYVFDADEFILFDSKIDLQDKFIDSYFFRLYDYYITNEDKNLIYSQREYIGPEYREIPMLFRSSLDLVFKTRVPTGYKNLAYGGDVKHYGKAISVEEWDKKCNYYINHLFELQPGNIDISEKWQKRKGKAIHEKSDFQNKLIKWEDRNQLGIELSGSIEKLNLVKYTILLATNHLDNLGGSETFTYTLIEELSKYKNIEVEYFTFKKGIMSKKIEDDFNVKFMSKNKYDLILANHYNVVEKLKNKGFIIQTCHSSKISLEKPNKNADLFVSISQEIQTFLAKNGFNSTIILNSINLEKFKPVNKINKKLSKVLSLCHSKEANDRIRSICSTLNLEYFEAYKFRNPIFDVHKIINEVDLVVGLGRSAYEAISCGRPVVIYDSRNYFNSCGDGYLKDVLGLSIQNNCSGRYSNKMYNEAELIKEFLKYNYEDGDYFREFSLKELDVRKNLQNYFELYWQEIENRKQKKVFNRVKKIAKKIAKKFIK